MTPVAILLQRAGIEFTEVQALHRNGKPHVVMFVARTGEDLIKFATWSAENDVDFDGARVATPEEVSQSEQWS